MKKRHCFWVYILLGLSLGFTPEQRQPSESPILESTHLETIYSAQGIVKFRLLTEKALHYESGDRAYPEGIYIEFFEADKQISWTGRANSVYFSAEENVYEFTGDVELKSSREERQLNTEQLYWDAEAEKVYTEKFIRIETEEGMLTGQGLTAKQDLSQYHIAKPQGLLNVQSVK